MRNNWNFLLKLNVIGDDFMIPWAVDWWLCSAVGHLRKSFFFPLLWHIINVYSYKSHLIGQFTLTHRIPVFHLCFSQGWVQAIITIFSPSFPIQPLLWSTFLGRSQPQAWLRLGRDLWDARSFGGRNGNKNPFFLLPVLSSKDSCKRSPQGQEELQTPVFFPARCCLPGVPSPAWGRELHFPAHRLEFLFVQHG